MDIDDQIRIYVRYGQEDIRLLLKKIYQSGSIDKYEVKARNKTLILRSNRPLLKAQGRTHKRPDWKLIDGELSNLTLLEKIVETVAAETKNDFW